MFFQYVVVCSGIISGNKNYYMYMYVNLVLALTLLFECTDENRQKLIIHLDC